MWFASPFNHGGEVGNGGETIRIAAQLTSSAHQNAL